MKRTSSKPVRERKEFRLDLEQVNGRMVLFVWDGDDDKTPIFVSRSVAPSQWDSARHELLITILKETAKILKENLNKSRRLNDQNN